MKTALKFSAIALSLALTACSSDDDKVEEVIECLETEELVDGVCVSLLPADEQVGSETIYGPLNSATQFVYFDLDTKTDLELTDEEAKTNTDWEIAINRYTFHLSAVNAENPVSVYNFNNNADFYDDEGAVTDAYLNSTPETELQEYLDVNYFDLPEDESVFLADVAGTAFNGEWYNYNTTTHAVTANTDTSYILKAGGGHGQAATYTGFGVSGLTMDASGFAMADITFKYAYGLSSEVSMDNAVELVVDSSVCTDAEMAYVSFASGATVTAEEDHDIVLTCADGSIDLSLAAADGKAVFYDEDGTFSIDGAAYYTYYENEYVIPALSEVSPGNYGAFAYAIGGGHLMWSDFNVYIIKNVDKYYKIQVTSYYNEENTSGHISLRADEIPTE